MCRLSWNLGASISWSLQGLSRPVMELLYLYLYLLLHGVGGQRHTPARFTHGKDPVPIVQEVGWASEAVWTGAENCAPTGIRSLDRPAHSKPLYRRPYPGSYVLLFSTYALQLSRLIVRSVLDVPTVATRRLHACNHARAPSGGKWNWGREMSQNFA
jgi:hypothetical protein